MKAINQPSSQKFRYLFFLFSLLLIVNTACTDTGTGHEEEPEEEIFEDQYLSITSSAPRKNDGNARWTEYAATDIGKQ